jgi:molybdate transport system substrate-binding protein
MSKIIKFSLYAAFIACILFTLSACGEHKVELTISAAASLTDSLNEIQKLFVEKNHNIKINFNFGASGALEQQIEQGAPADLFISASSKPMQALVDKHRVEGPINLLTNELVLIAPADGKTILNTIEDLNKPEVKFLAIGQPESVPAGSYTKEALTYYKQWETLQSKIVLAKDVRQVLTYVETGNSDAGFVYKTDALQSNKVKIILTIDQASYTPIQYPIGLIKTTKHNKEAQAFYDFLQSKEAQAVFTHFGFSLPKPL